MRVMFMGTPDIAVGCLDALAKAHNVCCVVTKEDKPKGRGGKIAFSKVKERALELGIDVIQPKTLKDGKFIEVLEKYQPDVIVVVAYGLILPKYVLDFPKYGCVNVHTSLLPKYRGAAPIQWCIIKGEKVSGITTMLMDEGVDTGDILLCEKVQISEDMTAGELHDIYCKIGSNLLLKTLDGLEKGTIVPKKQDDGQCCYAPMLDNENTKINWNMSAKDIINLVRGLNPFPTAYTFLDGKKLKVYRCKAGGGTGSPGEVICSKDKLVVGCADGSVEITELQLEGKCKMPAADFLRGYKIEKGTVLG